MSRTLTQGEGLDSIQSVPADEIEELGDEAIIAQQSQAHLPQKRANVREEPRSIVIAEDPMPSARRPPAYHADAPEAATLVMRDRGELDAMRRKIVAQKQRRDRSGGMAPFVWAALAIAAFAAGGLVTLLIVRRTEAAAAPSTAEARASRPPRARPANGAGVRATNEEPAPPQVKLEELPLEQPAHLVE